MWIRFSNAKAYILLFLYTYFKVSYHEAYSFDLCLPSCHFYICSSVYKFLSVSRQKKWKGNWHILPLDYPFFCSQTTCMWQTPTTDILQESPHSFIGLYLIFSVRCQVLSLSSLSSSTTGSHTLEVLNKYLLNK